MGLKVSITPQDNEGEILGSPVVICDGPDPLPTYNVRINGAPVLQISQPCRAGSIQVFDRKLRRVNISFTVKRTRGSTGAFSGPAEALAHALDQCASESACPHFGLIRLELSDGVSSLVRFLDRAGLEAIDLEKQTGVALTMGYQIIGGTLLKTLPSSDA